MNNWEGMWEGINSPDIYLVFLYLEQSLWIGKKISKITILLDMLFIIYENLSIESKKHPDKLALIAQPEE